MRSTFHESEASLSRELDVSYPGLTAQYPPVRYLEQIQSFDYYAHYEQASSETVAILDSIESRYGTGAVALFQKLALSRLIIQFLERLEDGEMDVEIRRLYLDWFDRIHSDFSDQPDTYYDYNSLFGPVRKDLAICSGRAIPIGGAWLVAKARLNMQSKIDDALEKRFENQSSRRVRSSLRDLAKAAAGNLGVKEKLISMRRAAQERTDSFSWYYEIHTVDRNIRDFNREQMDLAYRNIVRLLRLDPDISGVYRESWFLDPQLEHVSPELSFLRAVPQQHGAQLFCAGPCVPEDVAKILSTSPIRRRLYNEGKYSPKTYFYFWPREDVLRMVGGQTRY